MCGIYGYRVRENEKLSPYESTVLCTTLARDMESRGRDSWGGAVWPQVDSEDTQLTIFRGLGQVAKTASHFLRAAASAPTVLGHTRAATVGAVCVENCHPFLIGDVLGVHNGSVYNWKDLNTKYDRKFEVDSQQIFAHLTEGLAMDEVEGHGTVFYTRRNEDWKNIYLMRSSSGSLCVARFFRDDKKEKHFVTVWASEKSSVERAAALMGVAWEEVLVPSEKLLRVGFDGEVYDGKQKVKFASYITAVSGGKYDWFDRYCSEPYPAQLKDLPAGVTLNTAMCPACECHLLPHSRGECPNNHLRECRAARNGKCINTEYKACNACGCYLIKGIHVPNTNDSKALWCTGCKKGCTPIFVDRTHGSGYGYHGHNSGFKRQDVEVFDDTEEDSTTSTLVTSSKGVLRIVEGPSSNVTMPPFMSKKERKRLERKNKKTTLFTDLRVLPPLPNNIWPLQGVPRVFKADGSGLTMDVPICKSCTCDLADHLYGFCTKNNNPNCKASNVNPCVTNMPLCRDCGCFLVEGVHTTSDLSDTIVYCTTCKDLCSSAMDEQTEDEIKESSL